MQQADSIAHSQHTAHADTASATGAAPVRQLTPAQALRWLPRNATPAQQDSAIQAHFKPAPIRWSTRPDTLHLPGHDAGHDLLKAELPQYYREGFFSHNAMFHPELSGGRIGIAGSPVPYSIHNDDLITSMLVVCFLAAVVAFSHARRFVARQFKAFFYRPAEGITEVKETSSEMRFQFFLGLVTSLLVALVCYFYTLNFIGTTFTLQSNYQLIAIFFGLTVAYFTGKLLLSTWVNLVFFGKKKNEQWIKSSLFLLSVEGVLLFPVVLLHAYFGLSPETSITCVAAVAILVKIMSLSKCLTIFFNRKLVNLQFFLYFCTLEIVPLLVFWSIAVFIGNYLQINF